MTEVNIHYLVLGILPISVFTSVESTSLRSSWKEIVVVVVVVVVVASPSFVLGTQISIYNRLVVHEYVYTDEKTCKSFTINIWIKKKFDSPTLYFFHSSCQL